MDFIVVLFILLDLQAMWITVGIPSYIIWENIFWSSSCHCHIFHALISSFNVGDRVSSLPITLRLPESLSASEQQTKYDVTCKDLEILQNIDVKRHAWHQIFSAVPFHFKNVYITLLFTWNVTSGWYEKLEIDWYGCFGADTDISVIHGSIADISKIFKCCFLLH